MYNRRNYARILPSCFASGITIALALFTALGPVGTAFGEEISNTVFPDNRYQSAATQPVGNGSPCSFNNVPEDEQVISLIKKIAQQENFDPVLLIAIARRESGFRMDRISTAGAIGLMQLMPETADRFNVDICNPSENVLGAIRYLRFLMNKFDDNPLLVLAAYNAGEGAVERNGGIPPILETTKYVTAVMSDIYGWAIPQTRNRKRVANNQVNQSGFIAAKDKWSQGFVLHME